MLTTLLILASAFGLYAGTTGKISGRVTDQNTGEPLTGVNVVLEGARMGASTNADGYYFILNVPPGIYTLSASMIGYGEKRKTQVEVSVDLTTRVNFELQDETLETETITVVADRPLIQRDETAKSAVIGSETFSEMPVVNFQKVLTTQAGFSTDRDGEIHIRGGRAGEVSYMIDGIYVGDPYSGGFGSQLDKYSIDELQVLTGAFNAEYGQSMSGVINVVTKEGGSQYRALLEYETLRINESPFRQKDWIVESKTVNDAGYLDVLRDSTDRSLYRVPDYSDKNRDSYMPVTGNFIGNFSGPVPGIKNLTFFVSGSYMNDPGYLPWGYEKARSFNLKLTYRFKQLKINVFGQRNYESYKPYAHRWKYHPDGYEQRESNVEREGLFITHTLNNSTFYEVRLSRYQRAYDRFLPDRDATFMFDSDQNTYVLAETNFERPVSNDWFYVSGDNGTIDYRDIMTFTARMDITSQVTRHHLIKAGMDFKQHDIDREAYIQPVPGENHRYEQFDRTPIELALYVQDKLEYDHFILNLGLRYDYNDPRHTMWPDPDVPGYLDEDGNWIPSEEVAVDPKTQISPRIGVGFPITERTLFYGSYGHFFQIPSYFEMYGPHKVDEDQPLIGNPDINPQKTVAFEAGAKQQFGNDYVMDLNVFYKDITNLAGSTYHGFFPYEYTLYDNSNYAGVNGIDLSLTKKFSYNFNASLNYTYSVAKGNESDPREGYNDFKRSNFPLRPKKIFYLDFDRRHDMAFNMNYILSETFGPTIGSFSPLAGMQFNILFEAASGLPYTPDSDDAGAGVLIEKNTGREEPTYNLDLKILKPFNLKAFELTTFVVINNVFDRRNPVNVWNTTGLPWDDGPYTSRNIDRIYNPNNVSEPRRISLGIRIKY